MARHPSSGKYAITGIGVIAGPQPGRSERMLGAEAARLAMEEAGITRKDVGLALDVRSAPGGGDQGAHADAYPRLLGLKNDFFMVLGRGGSRAAIGIAMAISFLDRGMCKYALIVGADRHWSRMQEAKEAGKRNFDRGEVVGYYGRESGDLRAVSHHSWMAARHMATYGTTSRQLGAISVAQRAWACLNPEARMYGRPMTIEDHQNSALVVEPYRMLDMCLVSDGAVGIVLTTAERAKDAPKTPVSVLGQGFGEIATELWWEKKNYTHMAVKPAKEMAFGQAGLTIKDVDCIQMYDCFTAEVLFQIEDYGWCKKGEGGPFVESGVLGPGGRLPINTGGGMMSCYDMNDMTGVVEAVRQLRREAGPRQIKDCEVAMSTGHGGEIVSPGMCSVHSCTLFGRGL
jgi:acetyl-CoA acetyltransferase